MRSISILVIKSVAEFVNAVKEGLSTWDSGTKPWFRGESGSGKSLCPKIAAFDENIENYILQTFRRQAGGFINVTPRRENTDEWLFLAQHHGVPTRLLDWTEGALLALYFAINRKNEYPRVFMLNPRKLNDTAGSKAAVPNYPLSWIKGGELWVALAWQKRKHNNSQKALMNEIGLNLEIPLALPATYRDQRMVAQRSCFTIHGTLLEPIEDIFKKKNIRMSEHLFEYRIDGEEIDSMLEELSIFGVSGATIFPDLDHLAGDLRSEIEGL